MSALNEGFFSMFHILTGIQQLIKEHVNNGFNKEYVEALDELWQAIEKIKRFW